MMIKVNSAAFFGMEGSVSLGELLFLVGRVSAMSFIIVSNFGECGCPGVTASPSMISSCAVGSISSFAVSCSNLGSLISVVSSESRSVISALFTGGYNFGGNSIVTSSVHGKGLSISSLSGIGDCLSVSNGMINLGEFMDSCLGSDMLKIVGALGLGSCSISSVSGVSLVVPTSSAGTPVSTGYSVLVGSGSLSVGEFASGVISGSVGKVVGSVGASSGIGAVSVAVSSVGSGSLSGTGVDLGAGGRSISVGGFARKVLGSAVFTVVGSLGVSGSVASLGVGMSS